MIFLTVGTWRTGYDRLVKAVDGLVAEGAIADPVVAQIGHGTYKPAHVQFIDFCSPDEIDDYIQRAAVVIAHAGMGSIIQTLQQDKPMVVLPRKVELGEVDNDHQFSTAKQLEAEGKVLVAYDVDELAEKINQARDFTPVRDKTSEAVCEAVQQVIDDVIRAKFGDPPSRAESSASGGEGALASNGLAVDDVLQSNLTARAVAVVLIVLAHMKVAGPFWEKLGPFTSAGKLGVEMFTFYSGFLHRARSVTSGDGFSAVQWLTRRLKRLYPTYWIGLLLTLAVGMVWHNQHLTWRGLVDNFLGVMVWTSSPVATAGYARPFWYISLIVLCYLFFLCVRRVKHTGPLVLLAFLASAGAVAAGSYVFEAKHEYYLAAIAFPAFPLGMWAADRLGRRPARASFWQQGLLFVLSLAVSAVVFKSNPLHVSQPGRKTVLVMLGTVSIALATWMLSFLMVRMNQCLRLRTSALYRAIAAVGGLSYGIYCVHEPLLLILDRVGRVMPPLVALVMYVVAVLVIAVVLQRLLPGRVRMPRRRSEPALESGGRVGHEGRIVG